MSSGEALVWHELECGGYRADLGLWLELAARTGGPVLDVGAGSGRVSRALVAAGHAVVALDRDPALLDALARELPSVRTVTADARAFELEEALGLALVPMQTVQLLSGPTGRGRMFDCIRAHLRPDGLLACALADELEPYGPDDHLPAPDRLVRDEVVYESQPVALRAQPDRWALDRIRTVRPPGSPARAALDTIWLDRVAPDALSREGQAAGLTPLPHRHVAPTADHAGSTVVMWRG